MKTNRLVSTYGINDADYITQKFEELQGDNGRRRHKLVWICPFYRTWRGMLQRCYSESFLKNNPTYVGCSVCEEWKYFSNFKTWMETQNWEEKCLDKDLLVPGNKLYSAATCVFVTKPVNSFLTDRRNDRGECPIGVHWNKHTKKFVAQCSHPLTGARGYIGAFTTSEEAYEAWLERKFEFAKLLATEQDDPRVAEALIKRYEIV